jgi:hypothetical protein
MNPALWQALMAERVRDWHADGNASRRARQVRRGRRGLSPDRILAVEGQPSCPQAACLRST